MFPARFMLVCAMNPASAAGTAIRTAAAAAQAVEKTSAACPGPCWTASDLFVEVPPLDFDALSAGPRRSLRRHQGPGGARAVQAARFGPGGPACNDQMGPAELSRFCALDDACRAVMKGAFDRMGLTARSYDRILRVARTIADLTGRRPSPWSTWPKPLQYRPPEYLRR